MSGWFLAANSAEAVNAASNAASNGNFSILYQFATLLSAARSAATPFMAFSFFDSCDAFCNQNHGVQLEMRERRICGCRNTELPGRSQSELILIGRYSAGTFLFFFTIFSSKLIWSPLQITLLGTVVSSQRVRVHLLKERKNPAAKSISILSIRRRIGSHFFFFFFSIFLIKTKCTFLCGPCYLAL